jgi:hypothetical protein
MARRTPESAVRVARIRRAELAESETSLKGANDLSVRRALEAAGIGFMDGSGGASIGQPPFRARD